MLLGVIEFKCGTGTQYTDLKYGIKGRKHNNTRPVKFTIVLMHEAPDTKEEYLKNTILNIQKIMHPYEGVICCHCERTQEYVKRVSGLTFHVGGLSGNLDPNRYTRGQLVST